MKHTKLFEQFVNEAEKTEKGKYHPEVETVKGDAGDDRLKTAFGIHNSFGPSIENEIERYKKVNPADIKRAIKEVDQWMVIPNDRLRLKKFLAMFKTKNAKNLESIYIYVTLSKSQKQLERQYKVKGFIAQAEVFSQIAAGIKRMKLDQNEGVGTVTLKDIEKISKSLGVMYRTIKKKSKEKVDMQIVPMLADAISIIDTKVIPETKKLGESHIVEFYGWTDSTLHRKLKYLDLYVDQLNAHGNAKGGAVKRACNQAIKKLKAAIKIMAPRADYLK